MASTEIKVTRKTFETGTYTAFKFTDRKVNYEVVTKDFEEYSVWSNRFGAATDISATFNHYFTADELANRSKKFAELVAGFKAYNNMLQELNS